MSLTYCALLVGIDKPPWALKDGISHKLLDMAVRYDEHGVGGGLHASY